MSQVWHNTSFDGSPVEISMTSPRLVCLDPLFLDWVRERLEGLADEAQNDWRAVLSRINDDNTLVSCHEITDFQPGYYRLDPRDIVKFGQEDELEYDGENSCESNEGDLEYPFFSIDSGAVVLADLGHLRRLTTLMRYEEYCSWLTHEPVFDRITESLGGPHYAVVLSGALPGFEFDGDGVYTIRAGALRRIR